jgi:hypothetical protein
MELYPNRNGKSGVHAFDIAATSITVEFIGGDRYRYDYTVPGWAKVERMKLLARAGKGLASYISREIGPNYAAKLD